MPCHADRVRRNYTWRWWDPDEPPPPPSGVVLTWRRPSDTAAEPLERRSTDAGVTANVIEGDHQELWGV